MMLMLLPFPIPFTPRGNENNYKTNRSPKEEDVSAVSLVCPGRALAEQTHMGRGAAEGPARGAPRGAPTKENERKSDNKDGK